MLVKQESGCKVGWSTYDDKAEAEKAAVVAAERAARMELAGYDFGYQVPGLIGQTMFDGKLAWRVTTP